MLRRAFDETLNRQLRCDCRVSSDSVQRVDYEIKTLEREELKAKLDRGDDFKLVMAMHEWGFRVAHIPGSLHYNTVDEAKQDLDLDDEIVVYCTDPACVASQFAYRWLIEAGYTNVRRYSGGVSDWAAAGYVVLGPPPHAFFGCGISLKDS